VRVPVEEDAIVKAIKERLAGGRYEPSTLYGDGDVSARIADALAALEPYHQKTLHFIEEEETSRSVP